MSNPAKPTVDMGAGVSSLHRKAPLVQARPSCSGAAPQGGTLGLLRKLLGWTRPGDRALLDSFSDHLLRDIGIEPDGREDESNVRSWRRRLMPR